MRTRLGYNENIELNCKPEFTYLNTTGLTASELFMMLEDYCQYEMQFSPKLLIAYLAILDDVEAFGFESINLNEFVLDEEPLVKHTFAVKVKKDNGFKDNINYVVIVNDIIYDITYTSKR